MAGRTTALRVKRVIKGLTIRALASKVGYCDHTVSVIETGYQNAGPRYQQTLADFFGCQREELFDERGRALEYSA